MRAIDRRSSARKACDSRDIGRALDQATKAVARVTGAKGLMVSLWVSPATGENGSTTATPTPLAASTQAVLQ
jgi:hypothetical protein